MSDVTQILNQIDSGDPRAAEQLLPLVYDELRKLAAAKLAQEKPGLTLSATALVHEAYLRISGNGQGDSCWNSKGHFFAAAAEAMRRILVDRARRKARVRHGEGHRRVELTEVPEASGPSPETILMVDEAVSRLTVEDPLAAEIVKLHFFAGLTLDEIGDVLGISRANVYRQWAYARAVLRVNLGGQNS
jgi:RNA polymerase sigma factor (TIGR02999 family)